MGRISGDKSRFHRKRRQKLARRVEMRALGKELAASADKKPAASAAPPRS
ncbi:MAG TPA: hypothetical protein VGK30_17925 [Candidatus Binatia bacterium]|jgi:hypothetical protein